MTKNYENRMISKSNFMKQNYNEVERGIEYMNYQREVAILTDF